MRWSIRSRVLPFGSGEVAAREGVVEGFVEGPAGDAVPGVGLFPLFREAPGKDLSLDRRPAADTAGLPELRGWVAGATSALRMANVCS